MSQSISLVQIPVWSHAVLRFIVFISHWFVINSMPGLNHIWKSLCIVHRLFVLWKEHWPSAALRYFIEQVGQWRSLSIRQTELLLFCEVSASSYIQLIIISWFDNWLVTGIIRPRTHHALVLVILEFYSVLFLGGHCLWLFEDALGVLLLTGASGTDSLWNYCQLFHRCWLL